MDCRLDSLCRQMNGRLESQCKDTKNKSMAEKKNAISYESIMKDLKARKFAPVYVLMGDEPFYIDKICDYIAENVLQPEERDFNQTVLFGADTTAVQVVDQCKGYPMMAEFRVVIVKEAQNLKSLDALEKYLEKPVKSTVLVICNKTAVSTAERSSSREPNRWEWCSRARSSTTVSFRVSSKPISRLVRQPSNRRRCRWWQTISEPIFIASPPNSTSCSSLFLTPTDG